MIQGDRLPEDIVLAAYEGEVPCIVDLFDWCDQKAQYLIRIAHLDDNTPICGAPIKRMPFCTAHKEMMRKTFTGFWASLAPPAPCEGCGRRITLTSIEPINGG